MTMPAMNCDVFTDRLLAYLEHETDDPTRVAMDRHAVECGDCGPLLADLRKLRADAAKLPPLTPSRDLWSGIAARIEAPVVSIGVRDGHVARPSIFARRVTRFTLIAASLVGAAGLGYLAASRRAVNDPSTVATNAPDSAPQVAVGSPIDSTPAFVPANSGASSAQSVAQTPSGAPVVAASRAVGAERAVATLNADYDREITRLRVLIEQRRNQLDPVTVAIIEKNLQVIDVAITECKKAIAKDPASRFLIESLNQSLQTKVELMRTAALLPTRT